uniref:Putative secreted protein n=1 Tax=Anopheles marajoara TaxID=58244 RepID=A0A2M4CF51_9DIPT
MAYMAAILASRACAVQMLLVALSRRMCCSRVCSANRYASSPSMSRVTPIIRPGMRRVSFWRQAKKAACGPP